MSKIPVTSGHPLAHLVPEGQTAHEVTGDDRPNVATMSDPSGEAPTVIKSLRLPPNLVDAAVAARHPDGFSGIVREALAEWLQRHTGAAATTNDARQALATLQRAIAVLGDTAA